MGEQVQHSEAPRESCQPGEEQQDSEVTSAICKTSVSPQRTDQFVDLISWNTAGLHTPWSKLNDANEEIDRLEPSRPHGNQVTPRLKSTNI